MGNNIAHHAPDNARFPAKLKSQTAVFRVNNAVVSLSGAVIQSVYGGGVVASRSTVSIAACVFGTCSAGVGQITGNNASLIYLSGAIAATGNSPWFASSNSGSTVQFAGPTTTVAVEFTSSNYSLATVYAIGLSNVLFTAANTTLSGTVTGQRYLIDFSEINTQGQGVSYIPGTVAGAVNQGLYI